ncbi:unnamed protein product [Photorhabdus laumondii subsp. laumondii TTO1]|uniref:Photorhabdus luminescens subsp. laumondii TTO1 complete genome segment 15/17 n=1 Tax=Photorhabdus laumondii subsp. laumondii (strain DSM 15139 / CIP 105565 / TT01) TaxID=243265 RepID=Q7MZ63_PHOLL|nr:unnamed protein product [Photorhabdus laumondii subsp. laumondii TTO1]
MYFGAITFTFWFRLECFAVYASSPLLPPETQDSLRSGLANSLSTTGLLPARSVQLCPAHRSLHSPQVICNNTGNRGVPINSSLYLKSGLLMGTRFLLAQFFMKPYYSTNW